MHRATPTLGHDLPVFLFLCVQRKLLSLNPVENGDSGWFHIYCVLVSWIVSGSGSCDVGSCIHGGRPRFFGEAQRARLFGPQKNPTRVLEQANFQVTKSGETDGPVVDSVGLHLIMVSLEALSYYCRVARGLSRYTLLRAVRRFVRDPSPLTQREEEV